jgi:uncharacterized protein
VNHKSILAFFVLVAAVFVAQKIMLPNVALVNWHDFLDEPVEKPLAENQSSALKKLLAGARQQVGVTVAYDPAYRVIGYPLGDVDSKTGVCADVVVRAFRKAGLDLQQAVHEDMVHHFDSYPNLWGLKKADTNIDHRRVPNLRHFFSRKGKALVVTRNSGDYRPGDVVSWDLNGNNLAHIGLVSNFWSNTSQRYLIVHNIGQGAKIEDRLFEWKITGHYRYF